MAKDENKKNYDVMTRIDKDQKRYLVIEYYKDFESYDTIRLLIDTSPEMFTDEFQVFNGKVAYYKQGDAETIDYNPETRQFEEKGSRNKFDSILFHTGFKTNRDEIIRDPRALERLLKDKIEKDNKYREAFMEGLLEKGRVEGKYLVNR